MVSHFGEKWKSVSITSTARIFGLMGSGETASAFSGPGKLLGRISFIGVLQCHSQSTSRTQDHLIAVHPHLEGAQLLARVPVVRASRQVERPVVPWTPHRGASLGEVAVAHRGALVQAAV